MRRFLSISPLLIGAVAASGLAACAVYPVGPSAAPGRDTARITVRPSLVAYRTAGVDAEAFTPGVVTKLVLAISTVASDNALNPVPTDAFPAGEETPVTTAAGAPVTLVRTANFGAPVTFDHLRYGQRYRIRATAYRTVDGHFEAVSTTDAASYTDVAVPLEVAALDQTVALKVRLQDREVSARLVGSPTGALAQPPVAANTHPAIAYNPDTNTYVALIAMKGDTTVGAHLYAQAFGADGTPGAFRELTAAWTGDFSVATPAIAYHPGLHRYFIAFQHQPSPLLPANTSIFGGWVDPVTLAFDARDLSGDQNACQAPAIVVAPDDEHHEASLMVAWSEQPLLRRVVVGRWLDAQGAFSAANPQQLTPELLGNQACPALAYDTDTQHYMLAYRSDFLTSPGVFTRQFDHNGQPGDASTVSTALGGVTGAETPGLASNPTRRETLVAWTDGLSGKLYARRLDDHGAPVGAVVTLDDVAGNAAGHPAIAYNSRLDEYLVVWHRATDHVEAVGQRLTGAGALVGTPFSLGAEPTTSADVAPAVALNTTAHQALVARVDGSPRNLFTQVLDFFARPPVTY